MGHGGCIRIMMLGSAKDGDVELVKIFNSISIWQELLWRRFISRKTVHLTSGIVRIPLLGHHR